MTHHAAPRLRAVAQACAFLLAIAGGSAHAQSLTMAKPVPFSDESEIDGKILRECSIQVHLADFVQTFAKKQGIDVAFAASVDDTTPGRVLILEIRDAVSEGNPFIGHRKSTSVRGRLVENGEEIGSFRGRRNSMGGAFGGYKGSCSVLGRTVRALGEDIAAWLAAPTKDARLGDMK